MKNCPQQSFGPLVSNKVPNRPWEVISTDLITQLPESNGYNAIYVCYESPKKEVISHAFEYLIHNIKSYNRVKI